MNMVKKRIAVLLSILLIFSAISVPVSAVETADYQNGAALDIYESAEPVESGLTFLFGDVDQNGQITIADAILIQKHIVGIILLSGDGILLADVDESEMISIADAILIQKHIVGILILTGSLDPATDPITDPVVTDPPATELPTDEPTDPPTEKPTPTPTEKPTEPPTPAPTDEQTEPKLTVAGDRSLCGTDWDKSDDNNLMTYNSEKERYEKSYYALSANTYEYKIAQNGSEFVSTNPDTDSGNFQIHIGVTGSNATIWYDPSKNESGVEIIEPKFIITGGRNLCTSNWDNTDENNLMVYNAAKERYEKSYSVLEANTYEYKIVRNGQDVVASDASSSTGNIRFNVDTTGTDVLIWFKPNTGERGEELTAPTFVVVGGQNLCGSNWDKIDSNNLMTLNSAANRYEKVYPSLNSGTYEYKIARNGTEFVATDKSVSTGNIQLKISAANTKATIWFKPNTGEFGAEIVEPETQATTEAATYPTDATPMKGIDVSKWQGTVDFDKVKAAGVKFVILRAGLGKSASQKDIMFEEYYAKAKAAGLKVGAYWYSYATTLADGLAEAKACVEVLKGKQFEFPIYFDLEEASQFANGSSFCNSLVQTFCSELEKNGYFAGLCMARSPLTTYITAANRERYALWVAEYASKCNYSGSYGIWQYSSTGRIDGINCNVDLDWSYVDYSAIIKKGGFNNFPKNSNVVAPTEPPTEAPTEAPTSSPSITYPTDPTPMKGIDVSQYQGNIDFNKVKAAGVKFVIIRAGYGSYASQKDPYFEQNYSRAKAAGLKVGAYWYSYATTTYAAITEAQACMQVIKGKQFEFPIYFDLEEQSQFAKGRAFCDALVVNFCSELEKNGYFTGLYMSRSPLTTHISSSVKNDYALWVAEYSSRCNYGGSYGMWQYSGSGRVNGIYGDVDMDWSYIDYSGIIKSKGFNNFPKSGTTTPSTPTKTVDELAKEVLAGQWGNGSERRQRLAEAGYDPSAVQARVEELLAGQNGGLKSIEEIAQEVLAGEWGNGDDRIQRLKAAGYDPDAVQKKVNELLYGSGSTSTRTYTVVSGDNLTAIASKFGTTVAAIVEANKSKYPNMTANFIQVGWVLTIPS